MNCFSFNTKLNKSSYITFGICLLLLGSCNSPILYQETRNISENHWGHDQGFIFDAKVEDTISTYALDLEVHHLPSFSYQNLYLRVQTVFPSTEIVTENISIELTNGFGKWLANCKGNDCSLPVLLKSNFKFPAPGSYQWKIEQWSRDSVLMGISGITLTLSKMQKNENE